MTAVMLVSPQTTLPQWQVASWEDYVRWHDGVNDRQRLFFQANGLLVKDMGWEGISHAPVKDLFILLMGLWFMAHPERSVQSMSGCLIEQSGSPAAAECLKMDVNGMGFRGSERVKASHHTTVSTWVRGAGFPALPPIEAAAR